MIVFSIAKGPFQRNTGEPNDEEPDEHSDGEKVSGDSPQLYSSEPGGEHEGGLPPVHTRTSRSVPRNPVIEAEQGEGEVLRCDLIVEAMERRGNIVLVGDDNIVLESIRHVTPRMSRRPVTPREPYELPPRQDKRDPRHATPEGIRSLLPPEPSGARSAPLARALVEAYRGLSPQAAREVVFRCLGAADASLAPDLPWAQLAQALRELWQAPWQPCLASAEERPVAYAPYRLTHLANVAPQPSISAALDAFYAAYEHLTSHHQRREALAQSLDETYQRLEHTCRQLRQEIARAQELDRLRWEGEMILGFLHTIQPGQAELLIEGRRIALDPQRTPLQQAQDRFKSYDKAKAAIANVPERLRATEAKLAGLEQLVALLELAESYEQIEEIGREAIEQGYLKPPVRPGPKGRRQPPLRLVSSDGFTIYVGRSARQNELVTFTIGDADDLWLHARALPGAHVIIKNGGREAPDPTLREAASLAAYYSRGRGDTTVEVDISRRRLVRRVPGGPPGLVSYRAERTLRVAPQPI